MLSAGLSDDNVVDGKLLQSMYISYWIMLSTNSTASASYISHFWIKVPSHHDIGWYHHGRAKNFRVQWNHKRKTRRTWTCLLWISTKIIFKTKWCIRRRAFWHQSWQSQCRRTTGTCKTIRCHEYSDTCGYEKWKDRQPSHGGASQSCNPQYAVKKEDNRVSWFSQTVCHQPKEKWQQNGAQLVSTGYAYSTGILGKMDAWPENDPLQNSNKVESEITNRVPSLFVY